MNRIPSLAFIASMLLLQACTNSLLLHPDSFAYYNPADQKTGYEIVRFPSGDGTTLAGILFPSATKPARGTVVHFHGNAQNISAHFLFSSWLAKEGFNVLVFDYRGFGASQGRRDLRGSIQDGIAALKYAASRADVDASKLFVFGQSLGAAIAVVSVAESGLTGIRAVVLEGVFYSYRSIAREKLAAHWFTWPFQTILPALLLTKQDSPADYIRRLPRRPLLFIQSANDPVVPYSEALKLYQKAPEPKEFWAVPGEHMATFSVFQNLYGPRLVEFFTKALNSK